MFRLSWIKKLKIQSHYPVEVDEKDYYVFQCEDIKKQEYYLYYWELIDYKNNIWEFKLKFDYTNQKNPSLKCVPKEIQKNMKKELKEQAKRLTEVFETNQKHGFIEDIQFIKQQKDDLIVGGLKFYAEEDSSFIYFQKKGTRWRVVSPKNIRKYYYINFLSRNCENGLEGLEKEILSHPNIRLYLVLR